MPCGELQHMSSKLVTICFSECMVPQPFPFSVAMNGALLKQSALITYSALLKALSREGYFWILLILHVPCKASGSFCWRISQVNQWRKVFSAPDGRHRDMSHTTSSPRCILGKQMKIRLSKTGFTATLLPTLLLHPPWCLLILLMEPNSYSTDNKSLPWCIVEEKQEGSQYSFFPLCDCFLTEMLQCLRSSGWEIKLVHVEEHQVSEPAAALPAGKIIPDKQQQGNVQQISLTDEPCTLVSINAC